MKITWVLPQNYDTPIGGYKIVYQYANYLVSLGHSIRIVFLQNPSYVEKSKLYQLGRNVYWKFFKKNPFKKRVTWFPLDPHIKIDWNITPDQLRFNQDEKVIATAYWTANFVDMSTIPLMNKFYFLQDYELFSGASHDVNKTWKLPLNKFAVSSWLSDLGEKKFGEKIEFIPNFLDSRDNFKVTNSLNHRNHTIALLNHPSKRKNTKLGLEIIELIRKKVPDVKVKLFGTEDFDLSGYEHIEYFKRPSRKQLRDDVYNQSLIYLLPSEYEGWGLTAMEAMASGDIVVSNNNGGVNDFITNNVNGFIVDFNDKKSTVDKIINIFAEDNHQVAINATKVINEFSVEISSNMLLRFLSSTK
ncbi:glycosyltransferase family 4 protein [Leuconostoc mesenteroides]|uniref:GT n=1 Tax=Leuconostoc mesenteroides TaxID=1245 RepID=A0A7S6VG16_LEUME|nr:glycosyltransferase family 4 protein [Leuconostoc mesenteroides]MBZ1503428.1 glycosyltransferase family 4 protein [Leuconostoc mesenteroides]QOW37960.1 GT [Leuconostoc mesenteroides]